MDTFTSLGHAVDLRMITETLGATPGRGRQWIRDGRGVGHLINKFAPPVGRLNRSLIFNAEALNAILPEIRKVLGERHNAYGAPVKLDLEKIAAQVETYEGIPHVAGFMDSKMICAHFNLANQRLPALWAAGGHLDVAGTLGGAYVWDVKKVYAARDFIGTNPRPQSPRRPARVA
jgi:hypothetical protein